MKPFNENFVINHAEEGADRGVNLREETLGAAFGDPFVYDPVGNPEHGEIADDCGLEPLIAEHRTKAAALRGEIAQMLHWPAAALVLALGVLALIEFFGGMRVMTNFGFPPPENWLYGVGLALVLFALVGFTRSAARLISYVAILMLIVTSVAVGSMRLADATGVDGVQVDWAAALVTVITVIGPALLVEKLLVALRAAYPLLRDAWTTERAANALHRRWRRGMMRRREIDQQEREDAELRRRVGALFDLHYRRRRAEIEAQDPARRHVPRALPASVEVQP